MQIKILWQIIVFLFRDIIINYFKINHIFKYQKILFQHNVDKGIFIVTFAPFDIKEFSKIS